MKIFYHSTEFVKTMQTREVTIPFFGWNNSKKDHAIHVQRKKDDYELLQRIAIENKFDPEEYHAKYARFVITEVRCGFNWGPSITQKVIGANDIKFDSEFITIFRDFSNSCTESEYNKFLSYAFDTIKNGGLQ